MLHHSYQQLTVVCWLLATRRGDGGAGIFRASELPRNRKFCCKEVTKKMSFVKFGFGLVGAVLVGVLFQYLVVLKRWAFVESLSKEAFGKANWTVHPNSEIVPTYYKPGQLGDVLKEVRMVLFLPAVHFIAVFAFSCSGHMGNSSSFACTQIMSSSSMPPLLTLKLLLESWITAAVVDQS